MQVTRQFDSVNKVHVDCGHHPRRTVMEDMTKLLAQLHTESRVFNHERG